MSSSPLRDARYNPQAQTRTSGKKTQDGLEILFYVKAMYDYAATSEDEMNFEEGDVIAVTYVAPDGWWNGEMVDQKRRQPGRYIFPSNFVRAFERDLPVPEDVLGSDQPGEIWSGESPAPAPQSSPLLEVNPQPLKIASRQPSSASISNDAGGRSPTSPDTSRVNVDALLARMDGSSKTIENVKRFWKERAEIEEQYVKQLTRLAQSTLGVDELRSVQAALDALLRETGKHVEFHANLAVQIRDLEATAANFHAQELGAKETLQDKINKELRRSGLPEHRRQQAWEGFRDGCLGMEEGRIGFLKENMWSYANAVSAVCVSDDESCERIRLALDDVEPVVERENILIERDQRPNALASSAASPTLDAVNVAPSASSQPTPQTQSVPLGQPTALNVTTHLTTSSRSSPHASPTTTSSKPKLAIPAADPGTSPASYFVQSSAPYNSHVAGQSGQVHRDPQRLHSPHENPYNAASPVRTPVEATPPLPEERRVLFSVKALYDYTATSEEEFDFQAGDIIAVTEAPDDGWWTGELLDEARRQEGRNVFPSNFVTLF